MSKLLSSSQVVSLLEREGFVFVSRKGSHAKFRKLNEITHTVIVPVGRKEIPVGTLRSILRQANIVKSIKP